MQNSHHQIANIDGAFDVTVFPGMEGRAGLLVDDIVNSSWTFTLLAYLFARAAAGPWYPLR